MGRGQDIAAETQSGLGRARRVLREQLETLVRLAAIALRMVETVAQGAVGPVRTLASPMAGVFAVEKAVRGYARVSWALRLIQALRAKLLDDLQRAERGEAVDVTPQAEAPRPLAAQTEGGRQNKPEAEPTRETAAKPRASAACFHAVTATASSPKSSSAPPKRSSPSSDTPSAYPMKMRGETGREARRPRSPSASMVEGPQDAFRRLAAPCPAFLRRGEPPPSGLTPPSSREGGRQCIPVGQSGGVPRAADPDVDPELDPVVDPEVEPVMEPEVEPELDPEPDLEAEPEPLPVPPAFAPAEAPVCLPEPELVEAPALAPRPLAFVPFAPALAADGV